MILYSATFQMPAAGRALSALRQGCVDSRHSEAPPPGRPDSECGCQCHGHGARPYRTTPGCRGENRAGRPAAASHGHGVADSDPAIRVIRIHRPAVEHRDRRRVHLRPQWPTRAWPSDEVATRSRKPARPQDEGRRGRGRPGAAWAAESISEVGPGGPYI